ncbi:VOC family protein [Pedobacter sp. MR2016-24]|uniref:VOC family protein n=1 Tax=Pedobacter sp. MR2016-24 TaxID=2994466 RepID=UPI00224575BA|nr:VOC family protein [Pedobacter sp. MR2016-24]MCX2482552.1 VOC family protein [Pedobacter sp. MR2016-24]
MKTLNLIFLACLLLFCKTKVVAQTTPDNESAVLNHIAVYVTDLDKSEHFYHSLLNLIKIEEPFKDGKHVWFTLGKAGQMHLIKGESRKVEHDKNEHLCFSVASIPHFIVKLDQQKINYSDWPGKPQSVTVRVDGVKQLYFQDPDGHWIEVNDAK